MKSTENPKSKTSEVAEEKKKPEEKPVEKGNQKLLLILLIFCILLGLGGLGAGGFALWSSIQSAHATEGEETQEEPEPITETNIYFEDFPEGVVNLARVPNCDFTYLKYSLSIEVTDKKVLEEIKSKLPRLSAKVAGVMSNRDWTQISSVSGRESLAREVMNAINQDLKEGQAIGVYFTTFVAQ